MKIQVKEHTREEAPLFFQNIPELDIEAKRESRAKIIIRDIKKLNLVIKKNAEITLIEEGSGTTKINLEEKGAKILYLSSIYAKEGEIKKEIEIEHNASETESTIKSKNVITNNARVYFIPKVKIRKNTENTKAHQKTETLLLSKEARIFTIPIVEVESEKTECSHGSTITRIDEEKLFYLEARGIESDEAKQIIIDGFLETINKHRRKEDADLEL